MSTTQDRGTLVIAHRGLGARSAPENSLAAVRSALDAGCDGVEVDVRRTRDGALVLMHDPTPERTASGASGGPDLARRVEDTDLADLRRVRLRSSDRDHPEEHVVPLLTEIVDLALERGALLVVDVKDGRRSAPVWQALTELLLVRVPARLRPLVVVQGPDSVALKAVARAVPGIHTSLLTWSPLWGGGPASEAWAVSRPRWAVHALLAHDHERGRRVLAWTVNREEHMRQLLRDGADGIITDRPTTLLSLLGRQAREVVSAAPARPA